MKFVNADGGRSKYFNGSSGDCVCRAICNATGKDYKEVYDDLDKYIKYHKEHSRRRKHKFSKNSSAGSGVPKTLSRKYLEELIGWKWHPLMTIGSGCKVHLKEDELPSVTLIVRVSRHLTCVKDGVLYDTYDCTRDNTRCVYGYYSKD